MKLSTFSYWANLILAIAVVVLIIYLLKCCQPPESMASGNQDSLTYWRNKAGSMVASVQLTSLELGRVTHDRDSLARLLGTKPRFITQYITVNTHTRDTIAGAGQVHIVRDTVTGDITSLSELFASPYYTAHATIQASGMGSEMQLEAYDTLTVVQRQVRGGIQFDIMTANPHTRVSGVKTYRYQVPKVTWSLNAEAEVLYLDTEFRILTGGNLDFQVPWGAFGVGGGISDISRQGYGRAYARFRLLPIKPNSR